MRHGNRLLLLSTCGLFLFFFSACVAISGGQASKTELAATALKTGRQCLPAPDTWTASWIASQDQLRLFISRCHANRMGTVSTAVPVVDFTQSGVLALEMGQQRSAGYGFDTESVTASLENRTATVTVAHRRPAPGTVTAQVITSPWILIRLPTGAFREIRVVDHNFRQLALIEIGPQ